jgi:hypothetical protein
MWSEIASSIDEPAPAIRREIPKLVADEKIGHSLVVVALYYFDLWQRGIKNINA